LNTNFFINDVQLTLRPVNAGDDELIYQVYASTRSDEMALVDWTAEQKAVFLRAQVNAQTAHYKTHFPTAEQTIIQREGVPVGRLILNRSKDMIHIIDIALLPEARNAGIGSAVMKDVMEEAARDNRQVMLRVEFFNPARRLYARLGFVQTREMSIYHEMVWEKQKLDTGS
jgi:ribosomal protein S18 acetylase RimI-like enzyme